MSDEIDLELWAADGREDCVPKARRYRVRLWDGDGFDEKRSLNDPLPTGRQILDLFDRHPEDEHVLLLLSRADGLTEIGLTETIDIRGRGAERFFAFKTDRVWELVYRWAALSLGSAPHSGGPRALSCPYSRNHGVIP